MRPPDRTREERKMGVRDKKLVPSLKDFAEHDFLPFVRSTFSVKETTRKY
jgi:hypothetical protein